MPLAPQSPEMRALAQLVEHRRRLMADRVRITNRLTSKLKTYFPQVLQWCPNQDTMLFCDFLSQWPTLKATQLARRRTLERFFHQHQVHGEHRIRERLDAIKSAVPLTTDEGGITSNALMVQALIPQLRVILEAIERFDQSIAERAQRHRDYALFESLPGAGPVFAPRLLVAFGEQRERYSSAQEMQKYAGIAPVTERSSEQSWGHWRWHSDYFYPDHDCSDHGWLRRGNIRFNGHPVGWLPNRRMGLFDDVVTCSIRRDTQTDEDMAWQ